jgi:hypothetical protein
LDQEQIRSWFEQENEIDLSGYVSIQENIKINDKNKVYKSYDHSIKQVQKKN